MSASLFKQVAGIFLFASSIILWAGCRRDISYELDYAGNKLVINSILSPQRQISVRISRSNAPSGEAPPDLYVTDAIAWLYENNTQIEKLSHQKYGIYISPSGFKPKAGKTYSLQVTAPELPNAETMPVTIPYEFPLQAYSFRTDLQSEFNPSQPATEIIITLHDSIHTTDYYQVEAKGVYSNNQERSPTMWVPGETIEIAQPCTQSKTGGVFYKDICFNGNTHQIVIGAETSVPVNQNGKIVRVNYQHLDLKLQRISIDYFRYLESVDLNEGIQMAFFEPTFLYSNINNGYGIWAAVNEVEIIIPL